MINGTYWQAYCNRTRKENYFKSAHVHKISFRYKFDVLLGAAGSMDFVLTHDHFDCPEYVLKENVSLYQIVADKAIFVEVPENIDVWRCENGSFFRQAQFNFALRVITMPISSFNVLGENVGDPKAKLIFVQNTARCGSTLLVRIFENTGRCVAFSEPDALNAVAIYAGVNKWEENKLHQVTKNVVRLLCKPTKKVSNVAAYVMKLTSLSIDGAPVLKEVFPEAIQLFMYRDCLKVAQSLARATEVLPTLKAAYDIAKFSPRGTAFMVKQMGLPSDDVKVSAKNHMHAAAIGWCIIMKKYMKLHDENVDIAAIAYEDIHDDPEHAIKTILKYCELPEEFAIKGMEAMDKDAQENSPLAAANLRSKNIDTTLTAETRRFIDSSLKQYGLPPVGTPCFVPGTITHKGTITWPP